VFGSVKINRKIGEYGEARIVAECVVPNTIINVPRVVETVLDPSLNRINARHCNAAYLKKPTWSS